MTMLLPSLNLPSYSESISKFSKKNEAVNVFVRPSSVEDKVESFEILHEARIASLPSIPKRPFILGTRNSKLALAQSKIVKSELESKYPQLEVQILSMLSGGDKNLSEPLYLLGGKALWTKELEVALLDGSVDAIVHSLKDVPTEFPRGCELGAILEREDPTDALVVKAGLDFKTLGEMPDGSIIGTSSVRRVAQLRKMYPQLKFADVRGNLGTRLSKLDHPKSNYSALILASAGLIRLNLASRITSSLTSLQEIYWAVGQGAIGVERRLRSDDPWAAMIVDSLDEWKSSWTCRAERSLLLHVEGGCSAPVGVESKLTIVDSEKSGILSLTGTITSLAGTTSVIASATRVVHSIEDAELLGLAIAQELIKGGGKEILEELSLHVKEMGKEGQEIPFNSGSRLVTPMPVMSLIKGWVEEKGSARSPSLERSVFIDSERCNRPLGW